MNKELQKYIRQSFPEYSHLTTIEIFEKQNKNLTKLNSLEFFSIDIAEFFDRHKDKLSDDFIDENSFNIKAKYNGCYAFLHNNTELFLNHEIKYKMLSISNQYKKFQYDQANFDSIMFWFISLIKKEMTPEYLLSSFIFGHLTNNKDLTSFLNFKLLDDKITIIMPYSLPPVKGSNISNPYSFNIECRNNYLYILDYNSEILFKKELTKITKSNFLNEIIEPLKNIIINMNNIVKKNYHALWEQDLYSYLSSLNYIDREDLNTIKTELFPIEYKSKYLDQIIYIRRPKINISFLFNGEVVSYCALNHYQGSEEQKLIDSYNIYKSLAEADSARIELEEIISTKGIVGQKIKRI